MFWKASEIGGYAILATDGKIGTVSDFLFKDDNWMVRWLVVDTGHWLSGRNVLMPPFVLGHPDPKKREFAVGLTMARIEDCPGVDTDRPVSRQTEGRIYDYHGWRPYWGTGIYTGAEGWVGSPALVSERRDEELASNQQNNDDPHLRSIHAVTGYNIAATDGEIGHVEDVLVADSDWSIPYLIVNTKNWWPGKKVLISPRSVHDIDWANRQVTLDIDRAKVKSSPGYNDTTALGSGAERELRGRRGDPRVRAEVPR